MVGVLPSIIEKGSERDDHQHGQRMRHGRREIERMWCSITDELNARMLLLDQNSARGCEVIIIGPRRHDGSVS